MKTVTADTGGGTVSVIIPAYQAEHTIRRAIDSALAQTVPPLEIIVVDDGSPDQQNTVIAEYGPPVLLINQPNGRTASARNTGLDQAAGDFIAFLDADDYWEPRKLERQLQVFQQHPEVGVVGGAYYLEEPGCQRVPVARHDGRWLDRVLPVRGERAFRLATMLWTGTVIVRREIVEEQRFVSGLEPAEDRDMWARLVLRGPGYLMSEPLSTAVLEPGSISRNNLERDCTKMLEVIQRHKATLGRLGTLRWRSHTLYRWAAAETSRSRALSLLLHSFLCWPLPYVGLHKMRPLGRLKRLIVIMKTKTPKFRHLAGGNAS